jgi:hypothetical protein
MKPNFVAEVAVNEFLCLGDVAAVFVILTGW